MTSDGVFSWCCTVVVFDVLALFLAFVPFIILEVGAKPYVRGFFCDDESIAYPTKTETVGLGALYAGTLIISTAVILIVELIRYFYDKGMRHASAAYSLTPSCSAPSIVVYLYKFLGTMYFGFAVALSLTDIGRYTTGFLRPDFLAVCKPDPSSCPTPTTFATAYTCAETNTKTLINSRLGGVSMHASLSSYFAIFLVIYLQARFKWRPARMLKHLLQAACIGVAIFVSLSRLRDYKHSWVGVLSGAILGIFIACFMMLHVVRVFYPLGASKVSAGVESVNAAAFGGVYETTSPKAAVINLPPAPEVLNLPALAVARNDRPSSFHFDQPAARTSFVNAPSCNVCQQQQQPYGRVVYK